MSRSRSRWESGSAPSMALVVALLRVNGAGHHHRHEFADARGSPFMSQGIPSRRRCRSTSSASAKLLGVPADALRDDRHRRERDLRPGRARPWVGRRFIAISVNPDAALSGGHPARRLSRRNLRGGRLLLRGGGDIAGGLRSVADGVLRHALSAGDGRGGRGGRQSRSAAAGAAASPRPSSAPFPHLSWPTGPVRRLRDIGPGHRSGRHRHQQRRAAGARAAPAQRIG